MPKACQFRLTVPPGGLDQSLVRSWLDFVLNVYGIIKQILVYDKCFPE